MIAILVFVYNSLSTSRCHGPKRSVAFPEGALQQCNGEGICVRVKKDEVVKIWKRYVAVLSFRAMKVAVPHHKMNLDTLSHSSCSIKCPEYLCASLLISKYIKKNSK